MLVTGAERAGVEKQVAGILVPTGTHDVPAGVVEPCRGVVGEAARFAACCKVGEILAFREQGKPSRNLAVDGVASRVVERGGRAVGFTDTYIVVEHPFDFGDEIVGQGDVAAFGDLSGS